MKNDEPKLIPLFALAQRLYVPAKWLRQEAEAGKIPHLKAGSKILFNPCIVEKILLQRASKGGKVRYKMTNIRWKKPNYIVENMTVKEVAALLDMTVQNVYQVIHRYGKDRIAEAIREKKSTQAL